SGAGSCGGSNSTCSPPSSLQLLARTSPSTSAPASIARSAAAREPTCIARNESSREPAADSGTRMCTRMIRGDKCGGQDRHTHDDEAVCEVERRPPLQVEEVGHVPKPNAVD